MKTDNSSGCFKNINENKISDILNKRTLGPQGVRERYAVLALMASINGRLCFVYEKRALSLRRQPGEICFPGGKCEPNEAPEACAIRETCEELNITSDKIKLLGPADFVLTFYNTLIFPFVGILQNIELSDIKISPAEVDKIFAVPLTFFESPPHRRSELSFSMAFPPDFPFELIPQGRDYHWGKPREYSQLFYEFNGEIIWGLTARITADICKTIREGLVP